MRSFTALAATAACFLTLSAEARLGETYRQCTLRYRGVLPEQKFHQPMVPGAQHATFVLPGWRVRVAFVNGVSVMQDYQKESSHPDGVSLSEEEIKSILESEKGGGGWQIHKGGFTLNPGQAVQQFVATTLIPQWRRNDGALASKRGISFRVISPAGLRALEAAQRQTKAQQKARIPNF